MNKRKALAGNSEEDVDDATIGTPTPSKRRAAPQDIGIPQLNLPLGVGGAPPVSLAEAGLVTRANNPFFNRGLTTDTLKHACDHLSSVDALLAPLIDQHGAPERLLAKGGGAFASLSKSICFQQLATQAAAKIFSRCLTATNCTDVLDHTSVLATSVEHLRSAGLSGRKASYLHDLSRHFQEGLLSDEAIDAMTYEELFTALTAVKGLGPWSVDMFALFHLGLPDCLPTGDLGVRKGMQQLYGLKALPSPSEMEAVAEQWRPYRSVGSYYMWRVEVPRAAGKKKK